MISQYLDKFAGLRVVDFDPHDETGPDGLPPADSAAWRVTTHFEGTPFPEVWRRFCETVDTTKVAALVIGYWGASYDADCDYPVPLLAESAASFPELKAVFLGDLTGEDAEISWIEHEDLTPIFGAFPRLERLEVRGASGLVLEPVEHDALKVLRFETGGLPAAVVRAVGASDLPNLEHLDLWFGEEWYGGDATAADIANVLSGERLPSLRRLGLEDSPAQDEFAEAVASAPVVARLESLSLAMGTLTDRGAEALLSGQPLTHLRKLDLHHHFLSEPMMARLRAALPGVEIDLDDRREPDEGMGDGESRFFIAVSE